MAATSNDEPTINERDIRGLKYFDQLAPLLERLHDSGCHTDRAGNRKLHFDQYSMLVLLFLFNPIIKSTRSLQQASELENVQKKLGCARTSLGSMSESVSCFEPERLKEIIAELGGQLEPVGRDPRLRDLKHTVTLVDGTLLDALPRLADASLNPHAGGAKWHLHTHFEVDRHVPTQIDVTPDGGGEDDELAVLEQAIQPDRLYVMDRGYAKFTLFNAVVASNSSYDYGVCYHTDSPLFAKRPDLSRALLTLPAHKTLMTLQFTARESFEFEECCTRYPGRNPLHPKTSFLHQ